MKKHLTIALATTLFLSSMSAFAIDYNESARIKIFGNNEASVEMSDSLLSEINEELMNNGQTNVADTYIGKPLGYLTDRVEEYAFKYSNTSGGAIMSVGGQEVSKDTAVSENDKSDILALLEAAQNDGCIANASKDEKTVFRGQISILRTAVKSLENSGEIVLEINRILELDSMLTDMEIAVKSEVSFSDVNKSHWFYEDVMVMASKNYIAGKTEPVNGVGTFYPYDTITRAEFIAITMRIMYPTMDFSPMGNDPWWTENYKVAVSRDFVDDSDKEKSPELPISREEMAYITFTALKKNMGAPPKMLISEEDDIVDFETIDQRYRDEVLAIHGVGIIFGNENGYFNPKHNLTRAEASAVLNRLIKRFEDGVYYY